MDSMTAQRTVIRVLVGYLVLLAAIVFWPSPVDAPVDSALSKVLLFLHRHGAPQWVNYNLVEFTANIAMFVPFGVLLALILKRSHRWFAVVICFAATCFIELSQLLFLSHRVASMGDIVANTAGGIIGTGIVVLLTMKTGSRR